MAGIIEISPAIMAEKGNALKASATAIKAITEEIKNDITSMRPFWTGDAAEKFVIKFNGLQTNFQEKYDVLNEYAAFLVSASEEFSQAEVDTIGLEDNLIT